MENRKSGCESCRNKDAAKQGKNFEESPKEKRKGMPLDDCGRPATAETHRLSEADDACDDGVH